MTFSGLAIPDLVASSLTHAKTSLPKHAISTLNNEVHRGRAVPTSRKPSTNTPDALNHSISLIFPNITPTQDASIFNSAGDWACPETSAKPQACLLDQPPEPARLDLAQESAAPRRSADHQICHTLSRLGWSRRNRWRLFAPTMTRHNTSGTAQNSCTTYTPKDYVCQAPCTLRELQRPRHDRSDLYQRARG